MSHQPFDRYRQDATIDEFELALRIAPLSLREAQRELRAAEDAPLSEDEIRSIVCAAFLRAEGEVLLLSRQENGPNASCDIRDSNDITPSVRPTLRLGVERLEERKLLSSLLFIPC